jgi:hypothetical protein
MPLRDWLEIVLPISLLGAVIVALGFANSGGPPTNTRSS